MLATVCKDHFCFFNSLVYNNVDTLTKGGWVKNQQARCGDLVNRKAR